MGFMPRLRPRTPGSASRRHTSTMAGVSRCMSRRTSSLTPRWSSSIFQWRANFTLTTASLTGGAGLAPRRTVVRVGSGSVNGDWALRDFLGFYVETGSVSIDVKPEEEEKEGVRPTFEVEVGTGSVQLRYPPVGWVVPRREYVTKIGARTGSVGGNIVHGVETDVLVGRGRGDKGRVGSGSINLAVKPVEGRWNSTLSTEGRGSTNVRVLTPVHAEGAWKGLRSSHREGVGSVNLHYPAVWEGRIKGTTQGWGSLSVRGSGVEVIKESRGEIEAVKGHGEGSELEFWVGMGSGHLFVGDD
ncbi:hypothetical protein EJ06DRAFT_422768 [Trichodelitschia bisporula]|uniref:Uncharacterized protein n=1 Tax=Trichodelitschia bisporula TaxID=703511 RepID=A0A6G1HWY1_9PEZI|nr:hypothetical protein EJ06DRAFT_422768 [Trichodelitschia bisporula]